MARGKSGGHPARNGGENAAQAIPLPVIPESDAKSYGVLTPTFSDKAVLDGTAGLRGLQFACGGCGNVLVTGWVRQAKMTIANAAVRCGKCGAVNDLDPINH